MDDQTREAMRLWTMAAPTVSAFVGSLVRGVQDRDDVLQETAVAVMEGFPRFDPSQSFVAWAMGIARNQARLHFRRTARSQAPFDLAAEEALAVAFEQTTHEDPRLDWLGACLNALDARSRDLCRLRYEEDLKPVAIAARLGLAANTVAKSLERIRERLRACVERKAALSRAAE